MGISYKDNLNSYKDINLMSIGHHRFIEWDIVDDSTRKFLENLGIYEDEGTLISQVDVEKYGLYEIAGDYDYFYDSEVLEWTMEDLVKEAPYYLVMAHNCRWTGASGYKIASSRVDALARDYEVSIFPEYVSRGGKCLVCREHSHDVPTGARTSIIALTEREYEFLNHWNTSWEQVASFAERCEAKAALEGGV